MLSQHAEPAFVFTRFLTVVSQEGSSAFLVNATIRNVIKVLMYSLLSGPVWTLL